jgi:hypothetical protein
MAIGDFLVYNEETNKINPDLGSGIIISGQCKGELKYDKTILEGQSLDSLRNFLPVQTIKENSKPFVIDIFSLEIKNIIHSNQKLCGDLMLGYYQYHPSLENRDKSRVLFLQLKELYGNSILFADKNKILLEDIFFGEAKVIMEECYNYPNIKDVCYLSHDKIVKPGATKITGISKEDYKKLAESLETKLRGYLDNLK